MSEYKSIFSDKTFNTLTKKSAESLRDMLKGKSFMQASMDSMRLLPELIKAEQPFKEQLQELAKEVVYSVYPIVKQSGVKIDAKIVTPGELNLNQNDSEELSDVDLEKAGIDKRRLINSITQGASIRGTKAYYVFKDVLEVLDDSLLEKYNELLDNAYGIYDDDTALAMMLAMMSQNQGSQGGESEVEWDDEEDLLKIKAQAVCFPILVHEIIKGLYELIGLQGFSADAEKNKQITQKVDKVSNEPEDLRYGKYIYDALNQHVIDSPFSNDTLRELFFIEVYKLDDDAFKEFIEDSINGELTPSETNWVKQTLKRLHDESK